jgi:hypothetical protein
MKWATLLKDIKEKVGLAQSSDSDPFPVDLTAPPSSSSSSSSPSFTYPSSSSLHHFNFSPSRDNHELELDFKRLWEEFRSSSSEKVLTLIIHTLAHALVNALPLFLEQYLFLYFLHWMGLQKARNLLVLIVHMSCRRRRPP